MKIEDQVCSLEQATKLKELGVEQNAGLFYWQWGDLVFGEDVDYGEPKQAAFTVAELGVMLPTYNWAVPIFQGEIDVNSEVCQEVRVSVDLLRVATCRIESLDRNNSWKEISGITMASAMADMLIYMIESKIISLSDINARLSA